GCVTGNRSDTFPSAEIPRYAGSVSPLEVPVAITVGALAKKAGLSVDGETVSNVGGEKTNERRQATGYVDSNQIGSGTQVTYTFDRMNLGTGLQDIQPLMLQFTYGRTGKFEKMEIGGPMVAQAKTEEREVINELGRVFESVMGKYSVVGETTRLLTQGSVVQNFRMDEYFKALGPANPFKHANTSGPGFNYRLVGRAIHKGRESYLLHIDGNESLKISDTEMSTVMGGYIIVDAATGLLSQVESLAIMTGRIHGKEVRTTMTERSSIKY
ncbi:MAG: hypothetical protein VW600_12000, partial [Ferrovibrio sp.]